MKELKLEHIHSFMVTDSFKRSSLKFISIQTINILPQEIDLVSEALTSIREEKAREAVKVGKYESVTMIHWEGDMFATSIQIEEVKEKIENALVKAKEKEKSDEDFRNFKIGYRGNH